MSKKTRRASQRPSAARGPAQRRRRAAPVTPTRHAPPPPGVAGRMRTLLPAVLVPNATAVAAVVLFALIAVMVAGTGFVPLAATTADLWLIVNLVPVGTGDTTMSALPLLPALVLCGMTASQVHKAVKERVSLADLGVLVALVLLVPVLLTFTAMAMLYDAQPVYPVAIPSYGSAVGATLLVHGTGLAVGMGRKLWRALARRTRVPRWLVDSAFLAGRFLKVMGGAGLVVTIISFALHWPLLGQLSGKLDSPAAITGLCALSILYLPNAAIAGAAVLLGSGFTFGDATVSLFDVTLVPLPPLPLLVAMPDGAPVWGLGLLLIPAVAAGVVSYRHLIAEDGDYADLLPAGIWAGLLSFVPAVMAGGNVGVYGYAGPLVGLTALVAGAWLTSVCWTIAAIAAIFAGLSLRRDGGIPDEDEPLVDESDLQPEVDADAPRPGWRRVTDDDGEVMDLEPDHTEPSELPDGEVMDLEPDHTEPSELPDGEAMGDEDDSDPLSTETVPDDDETDSH